MLAIAEDEDDLQPNETVKPKQEEKQTCSLCKEAFPVSTMQHIKAHYLCGACKNKLEMRAKKKGIPFEF